MQEYERLRHATRLPREQIADIYLDWMQHQTVANGALLVAERAGTFLGIVAGWIEQTGNVAETAERPTFVSRRFFVASGLPRRCWTGSSSIFVAQAFGGYASLRWR